jgi:hypothetical protein
LHRQQLEFLGLKTATKIQRYAFKRVNSHNRLVVFPEHPHTDRLGRAMIVLAAHEACAYLFIENIIASENIIAPDRALRAAPNG